MAIDESPVAFNRAGAQRLVRATKIVENQYRLPPLEGSRYGGTGSGLVPAKTGVGGITAKDGTTAGFGDVTLYDMDEDGELTITEVTLKCWNLGSEVEGEIDILVAFGLRGPWVVVEPC